MTVTLVQDPTSTKTAAAAAAVPSVLSGSVRPHRRQPISPWDSPGKNTGVGCHFFLQCMKVKSESEVAQSCQTLCDPMDCSLPGSSIHGVFQARVLEWGAIAFSNLFTRGTKKTILLISCVIRQASFSSGKCSAAASFYVQQR